MANEVRMINFIGVSQNYQIAVRQIQFMEEVCIFSIHNPQRHESGHYLFDFISNDRVKVPLKKDSQLAVFSDIRV